MAARYGPTIVRKAALYFASFCRLPIAYEPMQPIAHIVDDDKSFRTAVGRVMVASGFRVASYGSGDENSDTSAKLQTRMHSVHAQAKGWRFPLGQYARSCLGPRIGSIGVRISALAEEGTNWNVPHALWLSWKTIPACAGASSDY